MFGGGLYSCMETDKRPRGLPKMVASRVGCSVHYARQVLNGREPNNSVKTALIFKAARDIMAELFPATDNEAK